jgi:hypothetical protein
MLKQFALVLVLLSPTVCHGTLIVAESGDFPGDSSNPAAYENLGVLSDPIVRLSGTIAGELDKVDAWTFTVPPGALLTDVNIVASGFDGSFDWVDLFSEVSVNPVLITGDLFSESLLVANHSLPLAVGPGTYKLTTISEQNATYIVDLVSEFGPTVAVPEPSALLLSGLVWSLVVTWYLVRPSRAV